MKKPTEKEVLERLDAWFPSAQEYWTPHHDRFSKINRFTKSNEPGAQWDPKAYAARTADERLTLTENLLGPFCNREVNKIKRSNMRIEVKPKDDGTDPKLAKVRQGLHRGVQQIGNWGSMFGQAADNLVIGGLCATRILTEYADPKSFRKDLIYMAVDPTTMFHGDGSHRKADFTDVTDSLVRQPYSKAKFKSEFDMDPAKFIGGDTVWGSGNTPFVNEYFFKEETPEILYMCIDGKERYGADLKSILKNPEHKFYKTRPDLALLQQLGHLTLGELIAKDEAGEPISRETTTCQIWWAKLAGKKMLKIEAWPGTVIPNFIGHGRKVEDKGQIYYYGLAAPAVDSQQLHNYAISSHAERMAYAPKIPVWAPIESLPAGQGAKWAKMNTSKDPVLFYQAFDKVNGNLIPPPHREAPVQSDPGYMDLRTTSEQGIKGSLGMWESALSAPSNERSGVAIKTREAQSDNGNYDWGANLAIMGEAMGAATDELISLLYDVPTQVRIVGEDDQDEVIWAASLEDDDENTNGYFAVNRGKFDILCKLVPSSDTKRQEAVEGMQGLFQSAPQMAEALADFYIKEQDWRLADEASERIRDFLNMKYPGLIKPKEGQPDPAALQQQLQQATMQMQQMQQALQQMQPEIQRLQIENQAIKADKSIDKERVNIEWFKAKTDAQVKGQTVAAKQTEVALKADEQRHGQMVDKVELQMDAASMRHDQQKDLAEHGLKTRGMQHQEGKDKAMFMQGSHKMRLDHEAKTAKSESPTGGKPGNQSEPAE
jgi:hypothetical protein